MGLFFVISIFSLGIYAAGAGILFLMSLFASKRQ